LRRIVSKSVLCIRGVTHSGLRAWATMEQAAQGPALGLKPFTYYHHIHTAPNVHDYLTNQ